MSPRNHATSLRRAFRRILAVTFVAPLPVALVIACGSTGVVAEGSQDAGGDGASSGPCRLSGPGDAPVPCKTNYLLPLSGDLSTCGFDDAGNGAFDFCTTMCGERSPSCRSAEASVQCTVSCAVDGRRYANVDDGAAPSGVDVGSYLARMAFFEAVSVDAFAMIEHELARLGAPQSLVLLRWVAVTLPVCVNEVFHTTVRPLSRGDRERLYLEQRVGAAIVGVLPETMPTTLGEFEAWYAATVRGPELHVGPKALALFEALQAGKRRLWLRALSAAFLPPNVRDGYGLAWGKVERATFVAIVRTVRAANGILPRELRATLAFHQGMSRIAKATGANVSTVSRVAAALGGRFAIPSALSRAR